MCERRAFSHTRPAVFTKKDKYTKIEGGKDLIEYYDFTKGGMQQIPGFETLGSKLLGQANPFWKSTENRAAKETTKQPQVKKTPVRTSRVSSMLRDDFLKGFNRDKDEKSFMFVEEPEREEDAFLSGFNQILNEEKKEQAERKKRQEKLTQIRANADKRAWEDAPQNEDDAFLQGFNEAADKPESAKKAPSKKDKILDGISTALTAASFIPGVDTVTNLLSVPVDLLRGDYISAGLDLVGAIPFVGEAADVARTARTADRIIDGARLADKAADTVKVADDVADNIKAVDKATDALKTADTAVDAAKAGSNVNDTAKSASSMKEIFDAAEDPIAEMTKRSDDIALKSPINVPKDAIRKAELKENGYYQIKYKWNADDGFEYTSRWHTRPPNSPLNQGDTFVVERRIPGIGYGRNHRGTVEQVLVGENKWISKKEWKKACEARRRGTITKIQEEMLDNGHWKA